LNLIIFMLRICLHSIDGHICWNSKRRLPLIGCQLRKTKFRFLCAENRWKYAISVFPINIYIEMAAYM
jgi:hypothetical protein